MTQHNRIVQVACVAVLGFMPFNAAALEKSARLVASEAYAKTVAAVCAAWPYEAQAYGLAYFLDSADIDAEPTRKAAEVFCAAFGEAYPTSKAEGLALLKDLPKAGLEGPRPLAAGEPEPQGFRIKFKIFGWEIDITIGKSPPSKDAGSGPSGSSTPPWHPNECDGTGRAYPDGTREGPC